MGPLASHVLLGGPPGCDVVICPWHSMGSLVGPPGGGKTVLWCLACSWRSFERWTGDASLVNCVSIRAAARLGSSLSVGDFGFRVGGDCSIIVSKTVAILSVLVSSLEVLDGSVG